MIVKKILLTIGLTALMASPAWAASGRGPSEDGAPRVAPPAKHEHGKRAGDRPSGKPGNQRPHHDRVTQRCVPHGVAYIASGLLASQALTLDVAEQPPTPTVSTAALTKNADATYSGELTVEVKRTNRHARGDKDQTVTYTVSHVKVLFALHDVDGDGTRGLGDVQASDRVKLFGRITKLATHCDDSQFTPETTIRRIVLHPPLPKA